jgi:hypothetical protein
VYLVRRTIDHNYSHGDCQVHTFSRKSDARRRARLTNPEFSRAPHNSRVRCGRRGASAETNGHAAWRDRPFLAILARTNELHTQEAASTKPTMMKAGWASTKRDARIGSELPAPWPHSL